MINTNTQRQPVAIYKGTSPIPEQISLVTPMVPAQWERVVVKLELLIEAWPWRNLEVFVSSARVKCDFYPFCWLSLKIWELVVPYLSLQANVSHTETRRFCHVFLLAGGAGSWNPCLALSMPGNRDWNRSLKTLSPDRTGEGLYGCMSRKGEEWLGSMYNENHWYDTWKCKHTSFKNANYKIK